jgi:hypothetical protein
MLFDHTALSTPLKLFPRNIPCVVPRNITVEERLGKCILPARMQLASYEVQPAVVCIAVCNFVLPPVDNPIAVNKYNKKH